MASLTTREIVLLGILGLVGIIVGFYHFYFTPQLERLADLNSDLLRAQQEYDAANLQRIQAEAMAGQVDEALAQEFVLAMTGVVPYFDTPEMQRFMESIGYPNVAPGGEITFTVNDYEERDDMFVTNTTLNFTAENRAALEAVVSSLAYNAPANRIVEFSVRAVDDEQGMFGELEVEMTVEFLTVDLLPQQISISSR